MSPCKKASMQSSTLKKIKKKLKSGKSFRDVYVDSREEAGGLSSSKVSARPRSINHRAPVAHLVVHRAVTREVVSRVIPVLWLSFVCEWDGGSGGGPLNRTLKSSCALSLWAAVKSCPVKCNK